MVSILLLIGVLISPYIYCEETISTYTDYTQLPTLINLNIGTPSTPLVLRINFGTKTYSNLGQFILDESIKQTNPQYYDQLQRIGVKKFYSLSKSSTSQIEEPFKRNDDFDYGGQISGVIAKDVLSYNNIKSIYEFACVKNAYNMNQIYYNGIVIFNRLNDNFIDQMFSSHAIKTSDYILAGSKYNLPIDDHTFQEIKSIKITFDLDGNSDYYNIPSNPLVSNSDTFQIMSYGMYLNEEDVTDKIKQRRITLDQITDVSNKINDGMYIPSDLFQIIKKKQNLPDNQIYYNCKSCQCNEVKSFPKITLYTESYIIVIKPNQYLQSYNDECYANINKAHSFIIASSLLFNANIKIMYQKQNNSVKIINTKLINHLDLTLILVIFPVLNGLALIGLFFICILWGLNFRSIKIEYLVDIQRTKYKRI